MEAKVKIEQVLPLTIFDEPCLKERVNQLFDSMEQETRQRVSEIIKFLNLDSTDELSYDNIAFLFKIYFYKLILNEAVEMTFSGVGKYNVLTNILSLLSEEKLRNAIMGKPMIDAFSRAIRSIPTTDALEACLHGSKILLLEKQYLGISNFPSLEEEENDKKNNY